MREMGKASLKKEKWTLSFDSRLKSLVVKAARRKGVYPVNLLEELVRQEFNPYGHIHIKDSAGYVTMLRKASRKQSDDNFLAEMTAWQQSRLS
jgi:hypothetical protein